VSVKFKKENSKVKRLIISCLTVILIAGLQPSRSFAQQVKLAQTGFNFLNISSDARAGALGEAVNSLSGYSGALSHNPATMTEMPNLVNATFSMNNWIADIKYTAISAIITPADGKYGAIGLSFQNVNYGEVLGTMVWNNDKGYINTEIMKPSALAVGIGYAKQISEQFGVGGNVRFAYQNLGKSVTPDLSNTLVTKNNHAQAVSYDFGTIFKTGIKSIAFGMSVRNFSQEVKYEEESFQLPLLFTIGISANLLDFVRVPGPDQSLNLMVDVTHPRAHPEQIKLGLEYQFMKAIALRGGYSSGDSESGLTFGFGLSSAGLGLKVADFSLDYSNTPFGVFNNVQRFTLSFSM
jgi:hypothetical protein